MEQNFTDVNFKLCKLVFMSHSRLHRKPDALTGRSPDRFIRLNKAKALLLDPENTIASALRWSVATGARGCFIRLFKKECGLTYEEWPIGK